jgi:hypothetical protein
MMIVMMMMEMMMMIVMMMMLVMWRVMDKSMNEYMDRWINTPDEVGKV